MNGLARIEGIRAWVDFVALHEELGDEVRALSARRHDGEAHRRRSYVRAVFAYVEGLVFALKLATLATAPEQFSDLEKAALSEAPRGRVSHGKVKEEAQKIPLAENVRFALQMFARLTGTQRSISYTAGWEAFTRSIRVRDRLMHPRSVAQLDVTDAELLQLELGTRWFGTIFNDLAAEVRRRLEASGKLPPQADDDRGSPEYAEAIADLRAAERRLRSPNRPPSVRTFAGRLLDLLGVEPRPR